MSEQTKTPDLMLELLEKAGYEFGERYTSDKEHTYISHRVETPNEWMYPTIEDFNVVDSFAEALQRNEVIRFAYAHYQERQEREALRIFAVKASRKLGFSDSLQGEAQSLVDTYNLTATHGDMNKTITDDEPKCRRCKSSNLGYVPMSMVSSETRKCLDCGHRWKEQS